MKNLNWRWLVLLIVTAAISGTAFAQSLPPSPDRFWDIPAEHQVRQEAKVLRVSRLPFDATKSYSLAELVDFADRNNPETRVAWESAKAMGEALHIAQNELRQSGNDRFLASG